MQRAYSDYRFDKAPCKDPIATNQCAVRMSIALVRCGFDLSSFPKPSRVHSGSKCKAPVAHVLGAKELMDWLTKALAGRVKTWSGAKLASARGELHGQRGILYFNNCFKRSSDKDGEKTGDHIDLWDGANYFNQILKVRAGENVTERTNLFDRCDRLAFIALA